MLLYISSQVKFMLCIYMCTILDLVLNSCIILTIISDAASNSPVLQSARPRAVDSGEAKMRTASWENVDKQMPRNTK